MSSAKKAMLEALYDSFREYFDDARDVTFVVAPGRVNLIGEYTDFNNGYVMPMTMDRGVYIGIRRRQDALVRVASVRYGELLEYELDEFTAPTPGSWSSYVFGVVEELRQGGQIDSGFEAVVDADLILGAGLSSSAALEVATAVALQHVFDFEMDPVTMVKLCQHVEHNYANVLCGIMDQFACRVGKQDHALLLDCQSLDYVDVPVELGEYRIVVVSSEVERPLASSAYNTRRAECQEAVMHFAATNPGVRSLRDVTPAMFAQDGDELSSTVRNRCQHVITENERVLSAVAALQSDDLQTFGALMLASHRSLRNHFEVSCAELDYLVEIAGDTDGVLGSRMTGAGFGGCTVSLVHNDALGHLSKRLNDSYYERFGLVPGIMVLERNLEAGDVQMVDESG